MKRAQRRQVAEEHRGDNLKRTSVTVTFGSHELSLDAPEGVWNPTPHGLHLGQMLLELDFSGEHVLELGTGCGIHAILLARRGAVALTLTEIDKPILQSALGNLAKHEVRIPIDSMVCDWTHVEGGPYDTLVTNPPFAKSGKRYRRYFIDTLILEAHKLLKPKGRLVFVQSSMADIPRSLRMMAENGMNVKIVGETCGPFRDYYFEDAAFMREIASVPGGYTMQDGVHHERLIVFEARL